MKLINFRLNETDFYISLTNVRTHTHTHTWIMSKFYPKLSKTDHHRLKSIIKRIFYTISLKQKKIK